MIGVIADDVTGGTDVAVAFRRTGMATVILFGQPDETTVLPYHDAVVIALKTRTLPAEDAVAESLRAASWLQEHGASQLYFKYCSTFDSKPEGNIGQVADALADLQGAALTVVAPSSPEHRRTQYMGNLFVADQPLAESPMSHHPLTPMRDSNVVRLLSAQTERRIELVSLATVDAGARAVRERLDDLAASGIRYAVVDAISTTDLQTIGDACRDDVLVTGAAGLAGGLGHALTGTTKTPQSHGADPIGACRSVALAGSCSARTREQVAYMRDREPSFFLDAVRTPDAGELAASALAWFTSLPADACPLIYSTQEPDQLRRTQAILGTERSAQILEGATGLIACGLVDRGVRRLVTAGGETSGAVVAALDIHGGTIGTEIAPGVPWIYTIGPAPVALLLKSGNFGSPELLVQAVRSGAHAEETSLAGH
ncbi:3-oxo-tetronate kinase [Arthrobacter sp. ZGTC412]|uniref:3-oxo-tetronate kinase n=1 Tax=Arthrobacter sp. ZGTC412 TaxID=2058900 RepID=UPI000CE44A12|nr:3-oxo-tetronate kinase [Arthrobacter sp. ZGTC412]